MMPQDMTIASRWNDQYSMGRYRDESPIDFVKEIINFVKANDLDQERGLYLGCGNGRNYIPLRAKNLDILGIDLSQNAISELVCLYPKYAKDLWCVSISGLETSDTFGYIVAIQVLQHGNKKIITSYFDKINKLLANNGMLFVRVNSISTEIHHKHTILEDTDGLTIRYDEGSKQDMLIHFFAKDELKECVESRGMTMQSIRELAIKRDQPNTGSWYQWELVCKKAI